MPQHPGKIKLGDNKRKTKPPNKMKTKFKGLIEKRKKRIEGAIK